MLHAEQRPSSNPPSTILEASTRTITPPIRFFFFIITFNFSPLRIKKNQYTSSYVQSIVPSYIYCHIYLFKFTVENENQRKIYVDFNLFLPEMILVNTVH